MKTSEIQTLVSLLNRLPMSPAEVAWVQMLIQRLETQNGQLSNVPVEEGEKKNDNG